MEISKSVVVVTEAGSPIGRAIALHFASLGAVIVLLDSHVPSLNLTLRACESFGQQCFSKIITDESQQVVEECFDTIRHEYGPITVLVNCWRSNPLPSLFDSDGLEQYCHSMSDIVTSLFRFGCVAASQMAKFGHPGVIINVADNFQTSSKQAVSGTRALISSITQSWSKELSPYHIRVGGIVPARLNTVAQSTCDDELYTHVQYEMVRNAEYIVRNDTFSGRLLEAELAI